MVALRFRGVLNDDERDEFYALWSRTWATENQLYNEILCPHDDFKFDGNPKTSRCVGGKTDDPDCPPVGPPFYMGIHGTCLRVKPASIMGLVHECESCERWYLSSDWPDKWLLCADCR